MRIAIVLLVSLFPVLASASAGLPKDKYICNCHLTPGITKGAVHTHTATVVKHHHHAKVAKVTPPPAEKKVATVHHHHHTSETTHVAMDYPGKDGVITSNKLSLPAGKSIYSPGQLVYLSGRVLDAHCVPVSDAIVDIWQTDAEGRTVHASMGERLSPFPTFAGSGRAVTDNLGRFNFVTVFPGPVDGRAPFIRVHVTHKDLPGLDTEMFFAHDRRNATDPVYNGLSDPERSMVVAKIWERDTNNPDKGLAASWDISLHGTNPYRRF